MMNMILLKKGVGACRGGHTGGEVYKGHIGVGR